MDIATLGGFLLAVFFFVFGLFSSTHGDFAAMSKYLDIPSLTITVGGTIAATVMGNSLADLKIFGRVLKKGFVHSDPNPNSVITQVIELANVARKEGLLALEEYGSNAEDEFLRKGIMLIVDGTDPELVRNILETELVFLEERHGKGKGICAFIGSMGPAFGMIGTLIGLVNMLQKLSDVNSLGPQMAVALITTLYGSMIANMVFIPMGNKLGLISKSEMLVKELTIEGLLAIQAGENPRIIEEKLKTFIPPSMRDELSADSTAKGA